MFNNRVYLILAFQETMALCNADVLAVLLERKHAFIFTLPSGTVSSNIPSKDFFTASVPSPNTCTYKSIGLRNVGKRANETWDGEWQMGMATRKHERRFQMHLHQILTRVNFTVTGHVPLSRSLPASLTI